MTDQIYSKFIQRWEQVMDPPPQSVGFLTPAYKRLAGRLKVMPWPILLFVSLVFVLALKLTFGLPLTRIASILQRGF